MNKRNRAQASSLFLLELTMAILFFSIASAVCVQIFVKSRAMSLHAEELNAAVREVSSAAEIGARFKEPRGSGGDDPQFLWGCGYLDGDGG